MLCIGIMISQKTKVVNRVSEVLGNGFVFIKKDPHSPFTGLCGLFIR